MVSNLAHDFDDISVHCISVCSYHLYGHKKLTSMALTAVRICIVGDDRAVAAAYSIGRQIHAR